MQKNILNIFSDASGINQDPKLLFGGQLKKYREITGLTQEEYADFHKTKQTYITELERGNKDVQVVTMQKHAACFGVNFYQLSDPDYPIPALDQMPDAIRHAAEVAAKKREEDLKEKSTKRASGEKIYTTGTAAALHKLLLEGFFNVARTSKDVYLKLNPQISETTLTAKNGKEIVKITGTLSKGRFAKLLDKLEPELGSAAVRFVNKGS